MEPFPLPEGETHLRLNRQGRAGRRRLKRLADTGKVGRTSEEALLIGSIAHWTLERARRRYLLSVATAVFLGLVGAVVFSPVAGLLIGLAWGGASLGVEALGQRKLRRSREENRQVAESG